MYRGSNVFGYGDFQGLVMKLLSVWANGIRPYNIFLMVIAAIEMGTINLVNHR